MVWFFERDDEVTRLVTWYDDVTEEYGLIIEAPDEDVQTERFTTRRDFELRLRSLERQFRAQNWEQRSEVHVLGRYWRPAQ